MFLVQVVWDLPCCSSSVAVIYRVMSDVESWVMCRSCEMEEATWIARPTIHSGELPGSTADFEHEISRCMADGIFQRWSWWPIISPIQQALLQCEFTILPPGGRLLFLLSFELSVWSDVSQLWKLGQKRPESCSCSFNSLGTLALCMLPLWIQPPQAPSRTESSHSGALVTSPSESELFQPGTQHVSEEASRWFQPPSHLSVPSGDPKYYAADTDITIMLCQISWHA